MQEYNDTDIRLHLLSQLIAKVGHTFVPKKEDESHTNVYFDSLGSRLLGRWIDSPKGKVLVSLNLDTLYFEWLDASMHVLFEAETIGMSYAEIEATLARQIKKLGINAEGFSEKLHFEIPDYPIAHEPVDVLIDDGLAEWKFYRSIANDTCGWLLGHLQQQAEVRIWPHHFDTGIYFIPNDRIGIGYGLAMEDPMAGSPYLYFSGYAQKGTLNYENVPTLDAGRWEVSESWKGAILPLSDLADLDESEDYSVTDMVETFIRSATDWAMDQ
jgi:hypothetical protein